MLIWWGHKAHGKVFDVETRLRGTKAGLLQKNLNEGYTFLADIFLEHNGAPFDMHMHTHAGQIGHAPLRRSYPHRPAARCRR